MDSKTMKNSRFTELTFYLLAPGGIIVSDVLSVVFSNNSKTECSVDHLVICVMRSITCRTKFCSFLKS